MSATKPGPCDCCDFKTKDLKLFTRQHGSDMETPGQWYCALCASTMASVMTRYYNQYSIGERNIMKAICYVGNAVIQAIKDSK